MGRKSILIVLKATSPEGETKTFTSIGEAAKELGFSERGVGKAFHEKRNRIGEYELEWLEPELDVHPGAAKRIERLKKTFTQIVCTYCGRQLTREERVKNGFGIYKLNEKTGHLMEEHEACLFIQTSFRVWFPWLTAVTRINKRRRRNRICVSLLFFGPGSICGLGSKFHFRIQRI